MPWFRIRKKSSDDQRPDVPELEAKSEPELAPAAEAADTESTDPTKPKRRRGSRGGRGRKKSGSGSAATAAAPERKEKGEAKQPQRRELSQRQERRRDQSSRRRREPQRRAPLPAAKRELLVSVDVGERRVAILEDERVAEVYLERPERRSIAGNIYLGRVDNVLPGMEAAFVEIGLEKNGFLYVDEIVRPELEKGHGRKIQDLVSRGQSILVQAVKDPMKTKGARLTTQISLPGRFVVLVPQGEGLGVSRRLDDDERNRLKDILKRLPSVYEIGHNFANVDITREPIPVVPTLHYQMGGIPTNIHGQVVAPRGGDPNAVVGGLYAVGECSCVSVHGANRLGTNSLLDLLVFGRAAGNHIVEAGLKARPHKPLPADAADRPLARLARLDASTSGEYAQDVAGDLRRTMQKHAGVFRTQASLDEGVNQIVAIAERVRNIHLADKSQVFNTARVEALEVENLIEVARATMVSAASRHESRGAHTVDDYGDTPAHPNGRNDAEWLRHTLWYSQGDRVEYKPVQMKPLTVDSIPPKVRSF